MIDQNSKFFATLTEVGAAKQANADALGIPWRISQMAVGDANGTDPIPSVKQKQLINEVRRAPLNQLKVDPANNAIIVAEQVIPAEVGGFWIREIALYDTDGDMVAVANCAPSFKPLLAQGSGRTQVVRINLIVSNTSNVELRVDPTVVLASRSYVDSKILEELHKLDNKQSVVAATTADVVLSGLQTCDGVALAVGDRVLVKAQAAARENGIYVAASNAWARAQDANGSGEVTSAMLVAVERGSAHADTLWQLVTDGPIVLGTTALTFQDVTQGFAPLVSPEFRGLPTAPTPPKLDRSLRVATTEFVQQAQGNLAGYADFSASTVLTVADMGKYIYASTSGITLTLPDLKTLPPGSRFVIQTGSLANNVTVVSGNGNFVGPNSLPSGSPTLKFSSAVTCEFISSGGAWIAVGGSGQAVLAPNGYEKSQSGLITQWGSVLVNGADQLITFPINFPNAVAALVFGQNEGNVSFHNNYLNTSGFKYRNAAAAYPDAFTYISVGY